MNQERNYPFYLLVLSGVVFLTGLGTRDFWSPVEPRYAEIARIMYLKNEWVVPMVNGTLYTDKPIFYFWLVHLFSKLAGAVNEWTVRLPAALGGIGLVLVTYRLGKQFYTARVGLWAGVVMATCVRVIWEARWAHLDTLFACFFTLSMCFAARAVLDKTQRKQFLCAYACMALATLTKGLIGIVLPALVLASYVIVRREWRLILEARLVPGIVIFLAIAAPWFVLVSYATDGKWLHDFFYLHHIQRYTDGLGHREPAYYYLRTLPVDFLPWTIVALPALFVYRLDWKWFRQPARLYLCLWFAAIFVFFSASDTKRDLYLLPLFPVVALFIAKFITSWADGSFAQPVWFRGIVAAGFAIIAMASIASPVVAWFVRPDAVVPVVVAASVMGAGTLLTAYAAWRKPIPLVCTALAGTMAAGIVVLAYSVFPFVDRFKSPRPVVEAIARHAAASTPLFIYADSMHDYNFYAGRELIPVISATGGLDKLRREAGLGFLLVKQKDLRELGEQNQDLIEEKIAIDQRAAGRWWYLVPLPPKP